MATNYKDPRWQKKRLEIFERDKFTCLWCGDTASTLCVHHLYYVPGREIWNYPGRALWTLCEDCHKAIHDDPSMLEGLKGRQDWEHAIEWIPESILNDLRVMRSSRFSRAALFKFIRRQSRQIVCGLLDEEKAWLRYEPKPPAKFKIFSNRDARDEAEAQPS